MDNVQLFGILSFWFAGLFLTIHFVSDRIITSKRLKDNQKAWDEYSKGMTFNEKLNVYNDWCKKRKLEKGWKYFYFPRIEV